MNKEKTDELVEIFAGTSIDAEIVNSLLNNSKIPSFKKDVNMGTLAPWQVSAGGAGAVKIMINSNDYKAAQSIVEEYTRNKAK